MEVRNTVDFLEIQYVANGREFTGTGHHLPATHTPGVGHTA